MRSVPCNEKAPYKLAESQPRRKREVATGWPDENGGWCTTPCELSHGRRIGPINRRGPLCHSFIGVGSPRIKDTRVTTGTASVPLPAVDQPPHATYMDPGPNSL